MPVRNRAVLPRLVWSVVAAGAALASSACGPKHEPKPAEPPPVKDTAFGDMVGTMDRARGVQDTVDAQKKQMDDQVRANEGSDAP